MIDVSQNRLFIVPYRYYRILLEELSDRIVLNVLDGVQQEIREGNYINRQLAHDILAPHRTRIAPWIASLLADVGSGLRDQHQAQLQRYLEVSVQQAIHQNPDLQKLKKRLLFAGPVIEDELQRIIAGLLSQIVNGLLSDLSQPDNKALADVAGNLLDSLTTPRDDEDNDTLRLIILDTLDIIKARVEVQQWKLEHEGKLPGE